MRKDNDSETGIMEILEEDIIRLVEERMDGGIESVHSRQLEKAILENPKARDTYLDLIRIWLDLQTLLNQKTSGPHIARHKTPKSTESKSDSAMPPSSSARQA